MAATGGGVYTEVGVDTERAEAAFKRLEGLADQLAKKLDAGNKGNRRSTEGLGREVDKTASSYRKYFREQRLEDRVRGSRIQSITGLAMAFSFMSTNTDQAGTTVNKLSKSMVAGAAAGQVVEESFFNIGMAGQAMGGRVGKALMNVTKYAGPIALVATAVAGLVSWMHEAEEEGEKMNEAGIGKMVQGLIAASGGNTKLLEAAAENLRRDFVNNTSMLGLQKAGALKTAAPGGGMGIPGITGPNLAPITDAERIARMQAAQNQANARFTGGDVTAQQRIDGINELLSKQNDEYAEVVEKIRKAIKETEVMAKWEAKINEIVKEKGSLYMQQTVRLQEIQKALQFENGTAAERRKLLDEQYRLQAKMATDSRTSLQIQAHKVNLTAAEVENQKAGVAELRKQLEIALKLSATPEERLNVQKQLWALDRQENQQRRSFIEQVRQLNLLAVQDQLAASIAAEEDRYLKVKADIEKAGIVEIDKVTGVTTYTKEAQDALAANERAHARENAQIRKSNEDQLASQRLSALSQWGDVMNTIGTKFGSDLTSKLANAIKMAVQVANALNAASKEGADPFGSGLGVFSSIVGGLLGFFDTGGHTGKGDPRKIAGFVHKNEVVFEAPLVERYGPQLMAMRSSMQRGYATGGMVGAAWTGGSLAPGEYHMTVDMDKGEAWLQRKTPGVQRFEKRKRLTR